MAEVKISQTELQDWTNHVKAEHSSIKKTGREMVKKAMSLGDYLKEKKDRLGYGKFLPWVETDCEVDIRTVQRYMKAAENRVVIEKYIADVSKYDTVSHLTLRGALAAHAPDPCCEVRERRKTPPGFGRNPPTRPGRGPHRQNNPGPSGGLGEGIKATATVENGIPRTEDWHYGLDVGRLGRRLEPQRECWGFLLPALHWVDSARVMALCPRIMHSVPE